VGWFPAVVTAVISASSSSRFSFSFLTRDSIALLLNVSLSPPCLWHIRLCTIDRQASAEVGALLLIFAGLANQAPTQHLHGVRQPDQTGGHQTIVTTASKQIS